MAQLPSRSLCLHLRALFRRPVSLPLLLLLLIPLGAAATVTARLLAPLQLKF